MAINAYHLTLRMTFASLVGTLSALAIYTLLPSKFGLTFTTPKTTFLIPLNRIGFWACLVAGFIASAVMFLKAAIQEWRLP
jgi:hypothetical protein